jgi:hypothetical protein
MPFGPNAYYDGQDWPRCPDSPSPEDVADHPELAEGTWECALPVGHGDFENHRVQGHSWAQTGD